MCQTAHTGRNVYHKVSMQDERRYLSDTNVLGKSQAQMLVALPDQTLSRLPLVQKSGSIKWVGLPEREGPVYCVSRDTPPSLCGL